MATSYFHFDAQGTTRTLTDSSQTATDTYVHDAFGNQRASSGSTVNPFRYAGEKGYYRDADSGTMNVRARTYQPTITRWQSEDPIGFASGDANLYRYVRNSPTNNVDPSGTRVVIVWNYVIFGFYHMSIVAYCPATGKAVRYDGGGPHDGNDPVARRDDNHTMDDNDLKGQEIETGCKTCEDEIAALDRAFNQMKQIRRYGLFGPNSNTYARQLLLNAGFTDPQAPANAPGWDYNGCNSYGGTYYDKNGNPKPPPGGGSWSPVGNPYPSAGPPTMGPGGWNPT